MNLNVILKNMKKIEKALLPGEKAFFPSENAHFLVESPLFFEGHKPLPWENQITYVPAMGPWTSLIRIVWL